MLFQGLKCLNPKVISGSLLVGCGHCKFCRRKQANEWATRLLMESQCYPISLIWTCLLTYDDDHLPENASLVKTEISQFMRRFRALYYKRYKKILKFRYYVACEYGGKTGRPHYHILFFGIPMFPHICRCINDAWQLGFVGPQYMRSQRGICNYVASYVTKKQRVTSSVYKDKIPEFATMSKTSGAIGYPLVKNVKLRLNEQFQYQIKLNNRLVVIPRAVRRRWEKDNLPSVKIYILGYERMKLFQKVNLELVGIPYSDFLDYISGKSTFVPEKPLHCLAKEAIIEYTQSLCEKFDRIERTYNERNGIHKAA